MVVGDFPIEIDTLSHRMLDQEDMSPQFVQHNWDKK